MQSTVLCLHSGGFTSRQWKRLREVLAPTHHVIAPDLIGYAGEPWPLGEPFHYSRDVDALVAQVPDGEVHLVGHSYGGFLACHVALALGDRVRSLALYEPVTFSVLDPARDADAIAQLGDLRMTWQPAADGIDEDWLASFVDWWNGPGAWAGLAAPTKAAFRTTGWKIFNEVASLATDRTGAGFAAITAPALVMTGTRSPIAAQRTVQRLAELLPRGAQQAFPDLGHMAPITHHALIDGAIAAHVRSS